ncbi:hypothetical protein [Armatimonas rosea]|uniref:Uncharacterized protein n=1 Tax=Armatimonas rosea TaxID=685828 RepID=A0A7W9W428_ARMRO|nr:hypothetical protein [Armatimonas rosea]MBB6049009.1 hypothetical protein [Armatimonas rosea]
MKTLTGQGFGTGHAMGRAARLDLAGGRATLDETLLVELDRWRRREDVPMGLVLVAEDPATALLLPLPQGAALNGVISERLPTRPPQLPEGVVLIAGVDEALLAVGEGELLLLEPERGRVTVEPSAFEVARLQAKHQPRVLLDEQNFPAFTTEGVAIAVWGHATSLAEAEAAMAAGADGLLLTDGPWEEEALWAAQALVGGGDLALALPFESLDPEGVVRLAARSRLRWCLHPDELPLSLETLRTELRELVEELQEENQRAELPRLASLAGELPGFEETISLTGDFDAPNPETPPWEQVPLRVRVEWVFGQLLGLEELLERGVAGVIVVPEGVAPVKEQIRHWG